ncbi:hypothetical protein JCM8208_003791 [Rhodotorula glutinis]
MAGLAPAAHTTCTMSMLGQIGVWAVQGFDQACETHRSVAPDSGERSYALTGLAAACELMHEMGAAESAGLSRKVLIPLQQLSITLMPIVFDPTSARELVDLERADRRALSTVAVSSLISLTESHSSLTRPHEVSVSYEFELDMAKALFAPSHALVDKFFWQTSSSAGAHYLPLVSTGPYILLKSVLKLRAAGTRRLADPSALHEVNKVIVAEVLALALLADISKANPTHARGVNESSWCAFAAAARGADVIAARAYVEQGALGAEVAQEVAYWCKNHTRSDARARSPVASKTIKHALDWVKDVLLSAPDVLGQGRSVPPAAVERRSLGEASRERFVPQARRLASRF